MKAVILVVALSVGLQAQASSKLKSHLIDFSTFAANVESDFGSRSADGILHFEGELDEVGGDCTVEITHQADGSLLIQLQSGSNINLSIPVKTDERIQSEVQESEDGSFSHVYTFGTYGSRSLTLVHADDAYDTMTIEVGQVSLVCGAYY